MTIKRVHVLDENTANKIAAGEVVDRPASVIKELAENSLDAGSHRIEIEISEGGIDFIRVSDDGCGMSPEDAQLAILRHATSKIKTADDLQQIYTLGFRGEAIPSIASVSKFSLTTRLQDNDLATYLEIHGGVLTEVREAGAGVGTTIIVRDLFFNTPARRKFLKSVSTESSYIHNVLGKLALSHPHVSFKLLNNGRQVLDTPGSGNLLETMASLYGHKLFDEVLPVDYFDNGLRITGYVGKPTLLKSSRQWQTFIVNSRTVSSRIMGKALDSAYHSLLPKSGYPLSVLNFDVPLDHVDVNVHPQKSEVKFSDEQLIFRAVYKAVSSAIKSPASPTSAATAISYQPSPPSPDWRPQSAPPPVHQHIQQTMREQPLPFSAVKEELEKTGLPSPLTSLPDIGSQYEYNKQQSEGEPDTEKLYPLGQVSDCYIIATGTDGLYIVDQHAAHERILYDRLAASTSNIPRQPLLIPLLWDFDAIEIDLIGRHQEIFHSLGISLDIIGPFTVRITELPADLSLDDAEPVIRECLSTIQESKSPSAQSIRHSFLQIASCKGAIKAGQSLNMRQLHALLDELCATEFPYTCPHGRPAIIKFTTSELQKMFKRT